MEEHSRRSRNFLAMHRRGNPLVMANAFDLGTARMLAGMGFRAIATTSGGHAGTLGRRDGCIDRKSAIAHADGIAREVDVPVSADLENGFGHRPAEVVETVRMAIEAGLAGCSIEDYGSPAGDGIYEFDDAVDRIAAASDAVAGHGGEFVLTARCENHLRGRVDFDDTCRRLEAYQDAGADVLMAPALPDLAAVHHVCARLEKPFSFMAGMPGRSFTVWQLADAGVSRISMASSLYRAAMHGVREAAGEVIEHGTFTYVDSVIASPDLAAFMSGEADRRHAGNEE